MQLRVRERIGPKRLIKRRDAAPVTARTPPPERTRTGGNARASGAQADFEKISPGLCSLRLAVLANCNGDGRAAARLPRGRRRGGCCGPSPVDGAKLRARGVRLIRRSDVLSAIGTRPVASRGSDESRCLRPGAGRREGGKLGRRSVMDRVGASRGSRAAGHE